MIPGCGGSHPSPPKIYIFPTFPTTIDVTILGSPPPISVQRILVLSFAVTPRATVRAASLPHGRSSPSMSSSSLSIRVSLAEAGDGGGTEGTVEDNFRWGWPRRIWSKAWSQTLWGRRLAWSPLYRFAIDRNLATHCHWNGDSKKGVTEKEWDPWVSVVVL